MATVEEIRQSLYNTFITHALSVNPQAGAFERNALEDYCLMLANAVANAANEGGGETPVLSDYVKKSGGLDAIMSGLLTADNEFRGGANNRNALKIYWDAATSDVKVDLYKNLNLYGASIKADDKEFVSFDNDTININKNGDFDKVNFGDSNLSSTGSLQIGSNPLTGFFVDGNSLKYKNNNIFHQGNLNRQDIDFIMKDGHVYGDLVVDGNLNSKGDFNALWGFEAGVEGVAKIRMTTDGVSVFGNIKMDSGKGILAGSNLILKYVGANTYLNANGGSIILGETTTQKIQLVSSLTNDNGARTVITPFGEGNFLWGFKAGFDGIKTLEMVSKGALDSMKGIRVFNYLDFNNEKTSLSQNTNGGLRLSLESDYFDIEKGTGALVFNSSFGKFNFAKPLYAKDVIGVLDSATRLENNRVIVGESETGTPFYLYRMPDGIKHYGNAYFEKNIGSESYASGFSGYNWRLDADKALLTVNELVVRKRARIYEMEIKKMSTLNGDLWVSSNCSGDTVEEIGGGGGEDVFVLANENGRVIVTEDGKYCIRIDF